MTKLEKVIKGLEQHMKTECQSGREQLQSVLCPYFQDDECIIKLCRDALELLKERHPRVLTLEEMKILSTANGETLFDCDMTFVWLEAAADGYINITRPIYSFHPEWGVEDDSFYVCYIGTDVDDRLETCDYNKTWRCWTARPTDEQREAIPWDEPPKEEEK